MHTIERQLQQCLLKIKKCALVNGFRFSKTKTQCMQFCQLRVILTRNFTLSQLSKSWVNVVALMDWGADK